MITHLTEALTELKESLDGDLFFDDLHKTLYATDASVYRQIPAGVRFLKVSRIFSSSFFLLKKIRLVLFRVRPGLLLQDSAWAMVLW